MAQVIQPISPAAVDELAALRLELADTSTVVLAEELPRMDLAEQALRFRLLPKDRALAVFEELDTVHQQELSTGSRPTPSANCSTRWRPTTGPSSSKRCPPRSRPGSSPS